MHPFRPLNPQPFYPSQAQSAQASNNAQKSLTDVIEYASREEFPRLLERACQQGAKLNACYQYDFHPIVSVVRANKPWAIPMLMARGMLLPENPPNDFGLLMEACRNGHAEMAKVLIDVAHMSVKYHDKSGKTALHYAVISETSDVVRIILEAGAKSDCIATGISQTETDHFFPFYAGLHHTAITPLMIAAAQGNTDICEALLEYGANPDAGESSVLLIAALHDNESTFDFLLSKGAKLSNCHDEFGRTGLWACVIKILPLEYMRKLVVQHNFQLDNGMRDSPLGCALINDLDRIAALMLAHDAPVESYTSTKKTIWDDLLPSGVIASSIADMVTAKCPRKIDPNNQASIVQLLAEITSKSAKPAALAASGIFTSLLTQGLGEIGRIATESNHLTSLQSALMTSWVLKHTLAKVSVLDEPEHIETMAPDEYWSFKTEQYIAIQRNALFDGSAKLIEYCLNQLQHTLSLEFFLSCAKDCPENRSLASFMKKRLAEECGAPPSVIQLIVNGWMSAAKWTKDWQVAPDSMEEGNRFLFALSKNLMYKLMENFDDQGKVVLAQCITALKEALPLESHSLSSFCTNPVSWLRKLENRSNLRPVNIDELSDQLQLALGLPFVTCKQLALVWNKTIDAAASTSAWRNPAELQQFLERALALSLTGALTDESCINIVPALNVLMLEQWKSNVLHVRGGEQRGQKRPPVDEPFGAPPRKEARS